MGAIPLSLRPDYLSEPHVPIIEVLNYALEEIEKSYGLPDLVVYLEEIFPFRKKNFLDTVISNMLLQGNDTIIPAIREPAMLWKEDEDKKYIRIDGGDMPRVIKEETYIALKGLGLVTHPEFIRNLTLIGTNVGLFKINDQLARIEVRGEDNNEYLGQMLEEYIQSS